MKKYYAKEKGCRIADIPYDEYLCAPLPQEYITPQGLAENGNPYENAAAIQKAIDSASGKTVYIPKGSYRISHIEMKSFVTLYIDRGAVLVGPSYDEYFSQENRSCAVLYSNGAQGFTVTGGGTVCGMGLTYTNEPQSHEPFAPLETFNLKERVVEARKRLRTAKKSEFDRPSVLRFINGENITVNHLCLTDSASWTFIIENCKNVTVKNTVIDNHLHIANADGIDITGGENIAISHCFIATADDALCLKTRDGNIKNVTISDCCATSFANCFKIGTETEFDCENVTVEDCFFFMPQGVCGGYSAVAIESADGANIKDVTVSGIEADGVSAAILIWLGNRLRRGRSRVGSVENILIENVKARDCELPCAVTGCGDRWVNGVTLQNIDIAYREAKENLNIKIPVCRWAESDYPEITRVSHIYRISHEQSDYWSLPCFGLYMRCARNVRVKDFACKARSVNTLDCFYFEDCENIMYEKGNLDK